MSYVRKRLEKKFIMARPKGGTEELATFFNLYDQTLESYQQIFGASAPRDLWPPPKTRFDPKSRIRQIDESRFIILPKPSPKSMRLYTTSVIALILGIICCLDFFRTHHAFAGTGSSYSVKHYEVDFEPLTDLSGDVAVTMLIIYNVEGGRKNRGSKFIGRNTIRDISVTDERGAPLQFAVKKMHETKIEWQFPSISRGQQVVRVHFTLEKALSGTRAQNTFRADWIKNWRVPVYDAVFRWKSPSGHYISTISSTPKGVMRRYNNSQVLEINQPILTDTPLFIQFSPGIVALQKTKKTPESNIDTWIFGFVLSLFIVLPILSHLGIIKPGSGDSDSCSSCTSSCSSCSSCGGCGD